MTYPTDSIREELSTKYISGSGIEIGALCHPVRTDADVTYVDRFDLDGLHEQYPTIPVETMCPITVVDDGEKLESISDNSQDFVIANHFIEHCEFPVKTVENWVRVLKTGGIIFCAVPNKDKTFDVHRDLTPITHLIHECETGISDTYAHFFDSTHGDDFMAGQLMESKYSIHYHVWDTVTIKEFFDYLCKILPLEILEHPYNEPREETVFIVRKI